MRPNREHVHVREAKDAFKRLPGVRLVSLAPRPEFSASRWIAPADDFGFKARVIFLILNPILDRLLNESFGGARAPG